MTEHKIKDYHAVGNILTSNKQADVNGKSKAGPLPEPGADV